FFIFSSRRRHTRFSRDWSSDVCSSDLSVKDAAHSTRVRPNSTSTLPSAWSSQWRVMVTGRSWSGVRPSARTTDAEVPEESGVVMAPTLPTAPVRRARSDVEDRARARDVERAVVDLARLGERALRVVPRRQVREDEAARPRGRRDLARPAAREVDAPLDA